MKKLFLMSIFCFVPVVASATSYSIPTIHASMMYNGGTVGYETVTGTIDETPDGLLLEVALLGAHPGGAALLAPNPYTLDASFSMLLGGGAIVDDRIVSTTTDPRPMPVFGRSSITFADGTTLPMSVNFASGTTTLIFYPGFETPGWPDHAGEIPLYFESYVTERTPDPAPVPEPASFLLFGPGAIFLLRRYRPV